MLDGLFLKKKLEERLKNVPGLLFRLGVRLGVREPLVEVDLLGRLLRVHRGSVRSPDYDDAWLLALALRSKVVVDVGANIGQAALIILRAASVEEIDLVDPDQEGLATTADNLIRNQLSGPARFVAAFVGREDDQEIAFWTVGKGAAGSRYPTHAQTAARKESWFSVHTITLDTLCKQYDVVPDLVKIDVEGAEYEVLLGSERLAGERTTRFFVEMHSRPDFSMEENAEKVLAWCHSVRYTAWYLKDWVRLDHPEVIRHRGRCHLLLQPADWAFPEWLRGIEQSAPLTAAVDKNVQLR